ncbi:MULTISPECIES: beta barrel domain-containing protein [Paenibacillus]|uniref:IDEAL domain-containing protein n=1 Tax=Paenibacillus vandeheii TaxID=3035917 RepID=A0ABT8JHH7_9BACL|nr:MULTISPECIES: hypothetical protein [Paenibacillus]KGP81361.1 hypothetical protein P363_0128110 [Paenibacillus sp. MAEPY1]KGP81997.1 hypothetical protein P364_0114365 [Paenibacillus sp. MAEPY2]MDN4603917.1 hypothetical protein [Paenibacillus vandeheii]
MANYQFKTGDTAYLTLGVNTSRYSNSKYVEGVVTKVGRKYVTVKIGYQEYQFDVTDELRQKTEYAADYYLYESLDDLLDKTKRSELAVRLSVFFSSPSSLEMKLTLEQMQRIDAIINE